MTARRAITPARVRRILLAQAFEAGRPIPCCLCGAWLEPWMKTVFEHRHALALGGADDDDNVRLAHAFCAGLKTNGTAATTAGSDKQRIAKVKRLTGETGQGRRKAKITSRGFPKNHRPIRGKAERKPT